MITYLDKIKINYLGLKCKIKMVYIMDKNHCTSLSFYYDQSKTSELLIDKLKYFEENISFAIIDGSCKSDVFEVINESEEFIGFLTFKVTKTKLLN